MNKKVPYLIVAPGLVLLLFFLMIPLITTFFKDDYNVSIFWRTIRVSLIVTGISIVLGIPTAYFIAGVSKKWRGFLMAMTLFPLLTNSVIRSFAWINILGKNGVVNTLLLKTGFAIIIGSVYLFLPTMIMTLVGVMENIEGEMLEAAEPLGANPMTAFRKIVLPLSIPGTIVGSILVFTGTLTANTLGDWQSASVLAFIMILTTLIVMKGLDMVAKKVDRREANHA